MTLNTVLLNFNQPRIRTAHLSQQGTHVNYSIIKTVLHSNVELHDKLIVQKLESSSGNVQGQDFKIRI